ncbi:DUF2683 family protein [Mucilaginibacter psychrotolerans]|uniref:Uncharacterized protein n=1 Tax=Mucilaginibacter psychrotolerans TaxID=1524096 RepID=A0A4Y8S497_9SPHI|nr:DUF2683 family protein [Mucilaginibacter psychrotolerans]TFF33779.1 hypothetical protein E2R66_24610 [Mucilaginibacter psychrotolerans]
MQPENKEQLRVLKANAKALKISVETEQSPYAPDFVAMVKNAEKRGSYKTVDPNDVWGSLNLK